MNKEVSLVYPRTRYITGDPPLGLCYIAANIREKTQWSVTILDATFDQSLHVIKEQIVQTKPAVVAVYVDALMTHEACAILNHAKEQGLLAIVGGPFASVCPERFIGQADIVCIGEGEEIMVELLESFPSFDLKHIDGIWYRRDGVVIKNKKRVPLADIDSLPIPALDLVDMMKYTTLWHYLDPVTVNSRGLNIVSSRGCPFRCTYCQPALNTIFGDRVRHHSVDYIMNMITHFKKRYAVNSIFFHDDTFGVDRKWLGEFMDAMKRREDILWGCNSRIDIMDYDKMVKMHESGLRVIHFGIESGSQRILNDVYKKNISLPAIREKVLLAKQLGIHVGGFFMLGVSGETTKEMRDTIRLAVSLPLDEASFSIVTPLPGTELFSHTTSGINSAQEQAFDYYGKRKDGRRGRDILIKKYQIIALFLFYLHPRRLVYILKHVMSSSDYVVKYPKSAAMEEVLVKKAQMEFILGKLDDMEVTLKSVLEKFPATEHKREAYYNLGRYYLKKERYQDAIRYFKDASTSENIKQLIDNEQITLQLGVAYYFNTNHEEASVHLQTVFESAYRENIPHDILMWLGDYWGGKSEFEKGLAIYDYLSAQEVKTDTDTTFQNERIVYKRATWSFALEKWDIARQLYHTLVKEFPQSDLVIFSRLGIAACEEYIGNDKEAEKLYEKLTNADVPFIKARAHHGLGNIFYRRGDLEEAVRSYMFVTILFDDELVPELMMKSARIWIELNK
ncbi:radical SAM protein, partial [Candidatus Omnitrophota bacterium]